MGILPKNSAEPSGTDRGKFSTQFNQKPKISMCLIIQVSSLSQFLSRTVIYSKTTNNIETEKPVPFPFKKTC